MDQAETWYIYDHDVEQYIMLLGDSPTNINSYAPLKIFVNILFPANSSYRLHLIKLKLDI